jgi:hypothetical protein
VLVGKAYINGVRLFEKVEAASDAAADIKSSGFLDKLANGLVPDSSAELVGLIALDLISLALGFVLVADLGEDTQAVKFAVQNLKKVVKSEKKSDKQDLNSLRSASDISTQLGGLLSGFQQGLSDQQADIFVNAEDFDRKLKHLLCAGLIQITIEFECISVPKTYLGWTLSGCYNPRGPVKSSPTICSQANKVPQRAIRRPLTHSSSWPVVPCPGSISIRPTFRRASSRA